VARSPKQKTESGSSRYLQPGETPAELRLRNFVAREQLKMLKEVVATPGTRRATYRGAAPTRVDTGWATTTASVRTRERLLREDFRSMRDRARSLEKNNVLAGAALDRATENVIGSGIRARPISSSPEFNEQVAARWKLWTEGKTADIRHAHTFGAIQRLFYRGKLRDGDAGLLLTQERLRDGIWHPRLQVIESEFLDTPMRRTGDDRIIDGVELNASNQATGYWLKIEDERGHDVAEGQYVRAKDFIYLTRTELYNGIRGVSAFNGAWTLFDQIVGYLEATVMAARAGACHALLVTKKNPQNAMDNLRNAATTSSATGIQQATTTIEPMTIRYLAEGESVTGFSPTQPGQNFPQAITALSRFIGLRFGLTIQQLLLDFEHVSYSSARAARNQSDVTAVLEQDDFAATFFRIYAWVVSKWCRAGLITAPKPPDWYAFEWIPNHKALIDPTKEITAAAQAIALCVDSRRNFAAANGYDFATLVKDNAEDVQMLTAAGLATDPSGMNPPPDPAAPDENTAPNAKAAA